MNQIKGLENRWISKVRYTQRESWRLGEDTLPRLHVLLVSVFKPELSINKQDTSGTLWKHFLLFAVWRSYLGFPSSEWTKSLKWHLHWKAFHRAFCQAFQIGMEWNEWGASLQVMPCWIYVGANSHHCGCRWERKMNGQWSLLRRTTSLLMDSMRSFNEV